MTEVFTLSGLSTRLVLLPEGRSTSRIPKPSLGDFRPGRGCPQPGNREDRHPARRLANQIADYFSRSLEPCSGSPVDPAGQVGKRLDEVLSMPQ
jgi:hypothetical protein